jgi:hypothetical protein
MSPEDEARVGAKLADLEDKVAAAEAYLADKRQVYDRANSEAWEAGEIEKAAMLLETAQRSLRRARADHTELLGRIDEEEERLRLRAPPGLPAGLYWGTSPGERERLWEERRRDLVEWQAKMRFGEFPAKRI